MIKGRVTAKTIKASRFVAEVSPPVKAEVGGILY
jgi:hypothetical protein